MNFQHLIILAFNYDHKALKADRDICTAYEEAAMTERRAEKWFSRFQVTFSAHTRGSAPVHLGIDPANVTSS